MVLEIFRKDAPSDFVELNGIISVSVVVDQVRSTATGNEFRYFNILYKKVGQYRTGSFNLSTKHDNGFDDAVKIFRNLMEKRK
jgi:hypothetical protein